MSSNNENEVPEHALEQIIFPAPKQVIVPTETYKIGDYIGAGGFSDVYECTPEGSTSIGVVFAVKLLYGDIKRDHLRKEYENIQKANHLHVVKARAIAYSEHTVGIIIQPRAESTLRKYLDEQTKDLRLHPTSPYSYNDSEVEAHRTRRTLLCWMRCLINTLLYLHSENIRHGDIKPENILIHEGRPVLTDFGLSFFGTGPRDRGHARTRTQNVSTETWGTVHYLPPEATLKDKKDEAEGKTQEVEERIEGKECKGDGVEKLKKIGKAGDVYSLGCVFWEMLSVIFMDTSVKTSLPGTNEPFTKFWERQLGESIFQKESQLWQNQGRGTEHSRKLEELRNAVDLFQYQASRELMWELCSRFRPPRELRHSFSEVMVGAYLMATDMIDLERKLVSELQQDLQRRCGDHWWALHEARTDRDFLVYPCTLDYDGHFIIR